MNLLSIYPKYKENSLSGRYITNNHIESVLEKFKNDFKISIIGNSVNSLPIYSVEIGTGKIKIYMWSQMHGNETTTTKAVFDLFNFLKSSHELATIIKERFTLLIIPILNPDGAALYTRANQNLVDLNRDSLDLTQPESKILRRLFEEFKPDFCFNLHDQRTIFGVGDTNKPATVSFLAPAFNSERDINDTRRKAIAVIVAMNQELQKHIPNQVGRFDDSFNINCIGDMFQSLNVPTILFEAGHFQEDYQREETRKFIFISLMSGISAINENVIVFDKTQDYLNISQNKVNFFDIVYKNIKINYNSTNIITNFASQFKEVLVEGKIVFEAYISKIGELDDFFGHLEYECDGMIYNDELNNIPEIDMKTNFNLNKSVKFVNGLRKT
jgi:hypothetical protein